MLCISSRACECDGVMSDSLLFGVWISVDVYEVRLCVQFGFCRLPSCRITFRRHLARAFWNQTWGTQNTWGWSAKCMKLILPVKPFSRAPFSGPIAWDPLHRDFDLLRSKISSFSAGGAWTTFSSFCCGCSASSHRPTGEIGCRHKMTCPCCPSSTPRRSTALERNFLQ